MTFTSVPDWLDHLHRADSGLTFTTQGSEQFTSYEQMGSKARRTAGALRDFGLCRGDRALLVLLDESSFVDAFMGCIRAGVLPVPAYPPVLGDALQYTANLRAIADNCGAAAIITDAPSLQSVVDVGPRPVTLEEIDRHRGADVDVAVHCNADDPVFLQYTSGSTGAPKGVRVTHASLLANVTAISNALKVTPEDRGFSWLPFYHDMGLIGFLFVPMLSQAPSWYLSPFEFALRPAAWLEGISRYRATISFAPNFAYSLLARRASAEAVADWEFGQWRVAGCGAEPIHPSVLEAFAQKMSAASFDPRAFVACYGLAECTLAVTMHTDLEAPRVLSIDRDAAETERVARPAHEGGSSRVVSSGTVLPEHDVSIRDSDGNELADGQIGEIHVSGPSVTPGYWDRSHETLPGGWLATGDLGFRHDGHLYVTGRVKDLVIVNGRNYAPHDIEWAAERVPGVRLGGVVAFAVSDTTRERLVIVAETTSGDVEGQLPGRVAGHVAAAIGVAPDRVVIVRRDSLPKTSSGKLRRSEAARRYAAGEFSAVPYPESPPVSAEVLDGAP